jgi:hypothetical protein
MIGYKITFSDGTQGWQLMTNERMTLGLYATDGAPLFKQGGYSVTDGGGSPTVGVLPLPAWASGITEPSVPPPPVPQQVTPYQARVALLGAGLLDTVNALMAHEDTPAPAKIAWEYATYIERHSPFITALAPALGLTEQQVDDLFVAAYGIT